MTDITTLVRADSGLDSMNAINENFANIVSELALKQHQTFLTVGKADANYIAGETAADVQIQAAIDAAWVAGGGAVFIKRSDTPYEITTVIQLKSGVYLFGEGIGTVLKLKANRAANVHMIYFHNKDKGGIYNICLDGNRANQTQNLFNIYVNNSTDFIMSNCYITGAYSDGVHLRTNGGRHHIVNNWVYENGENGIIALDGCNDVIIAENTVKDNGLLAGGGNGIMVGNTIDAQTTDRVMVSNNKISGHSQNGIFISKTTYVQVQGNISTGNTQRGIGIDSSNQNNALIVGNQLAGNTIGAMSTLNGTNTLAFNNPPAIAALNINTTDGRVNMNGDADFGVVGYNAAQIQIRGKTDSNKRLSMGFSTADNYGFIQAAIEGSSYNPLLISPSGGSTVIGGAALATNATTGFVYIPTQAGTPTGAPVGYTGRVAMSYDTSANKLWIYNGSWRSVTLS